MGCIQEKDTRAEKRRGGGNDCLAQLRYTRAKKKSVGRNCLAQLMLSMRGQSGADD